MKLYNTLRKKKEEFVPLREEVGLYTCGPTVYDYVHIGNLRTYIFEDILKRTLLYNEYKVKHVMNITDVGHLTSDEDTGEDKIERSAREKKKTAWEVAEYYTEAFERDIQDLNVKEPDVYVKATEKIEEQIDLIKTLEEKGYTYVIEDGVYFDTSKLPTYGKLTNLDEIEAGKRVDVGEKRNSTDFALWKFSKPGEKRQMEWDSPWGVGFPGWHTECVVMAKEALGIPFDIHCGGIDHIEVHHPNEIAQSEAAFGDNLARIWMHGEFLNLRDEKMSKSKGGIVTLYELKKKGFHPLSFRYLTLNAHYRSKLNFSLEALQGAQRSLERAKEKVSQMNPEKGSPLEEYRAEFREALNDDLNTPKALEVFWNLLKDPEKREEDKMATVKEFDQVLGLDLTKDERVLEEHEIPEEIKELAEKREEKRRNREFEKADKIREEISSMGYQIEDTKNGYKIRKHG